MDNLKTFYTSFTHVCNVTHLWSEWQKVIKNSRSRMGLVNRYYLNNKALPFTFRSCMLYLFIFFTQSNFFCWLIQLIIQLTQWCLSFNCNGFSTVILESGNTGCLQLLHLHLIMYTQQYTQHIRYETINVSLFILFIYLLIGSVWRAIQKWLDVLKALFHTFASVTRMTVLMAASYSHIRCVTVQMSREVLLVQTC